MRTVILLSGGLDSSTLLYHLLNQQHEVTALGVSYGQRHVLELEAARKIADAAGVPLVLCNAETALAPVFAQARSSQVGEQQAVPEGHYAADNMAITVVPNRNMLLLAIAGALAESIGASAVAYAAHAGDHAQYPDCRIEFIESCAQTLKLATGIELLGMFGKITKADIVKLGAELGVPFQLTRSCYSSATLHCGRCGTCVERAEAFAFAGVFDPTVYLDAEYWKVVTK